MASRASSDQTWDGPPVPRTPNPHSRTPPEKAPEAEEEEVLLADLEGPYDIGHPLKSIAVDGETWRSVLPEPVLLQTKARKIKFPQGRPTNAQRLERARAERDGTFVEEKEPDELIYFSLDRSKMEFNVVDEKNLLHPQKAPVAVKAVTVSRAIYTHWRPHIILLRNHGAGNIKIEMLTHGLAEICIKELELKTEIEVEIISPKAMDNLFRRMGSE